MTEKFIIDVAQYVGANIDLDPKEHLAELRSFLKHYTNLYRIWAEDDSDHVEQRLRTMKTLATTRSLKSIKALAIDGDHDEGNVITMHSGVGFMPIPIIRKALELNIVPKEKRFLEEIIHYNDYQQEVLLIKPDKEFVYYGMWMGDDIERF
jgi:hypothetical protein